MNDSKKTLDQSELKAGHEHSSASEVVVAERVEGLFRLLRSPSVGELDAIPENLLVGCELTDFEIIRELAEGGMGRVFLARQKSLDRLVALKICSAQSRLSDSAKERFANEGKALARLSNRYVVPVIAQEEHDGTLFLVMEYVEGPTLADVLKAISTAGPEQTASEVASDVMKSDLEVQHSNVWDRDPAIIDRRYQMWVVELLLKVAEGLASIHSEGIVHRDIKPANIILDSSGEPKIVDFGLASIPAESSLTQTGDFLGTPAYASPEQLCGESSEIASRSDIYSFGVVFFECLGLRRPFESKSASKEALIKQSENPPLLRKLINTTPWELEAIVDKCLCRNPDARYETAEALVNDLQNFLALRPITAKKATAHRRLARVIQRKPWAFASTVLGIIVLFLTVTAVVSAARSAAEKERVQREKHYEQLVSVGDSAIFRLLVAERPTWMKGYLSTIRKEGINAYSDAIDLFPERVWPIMQRGRLYSSKKETLAEALVDFRDALEIKPEYGGIAAYLNHFDQRTEQTPVSVESPEYLELTTDPVDLYWKGTFFSLIAKDMEAANNIYLRCLAADPTNYWARIEKVQKSALPNVSSRFSTEYRIQQLEIAETLRPDLPFAAELLVIWLQLTDPQQAREKLNELIEGFGMTVLNAHSLAEFSTADSRFDEARAILLKVKPEDTKGGTASKLGNLEQRLGNSTEAVRWYEIARNEFLEIDPWCLMDTADAYTSLHRLPEAEEAYKEAIGFVEAMNVNELRSSPDELGAWVYSSYARWLEKQGRIEDATEAFEKLLALRIRNYAHFNDYAQLLLRNKRPQQAYEILQQGIEDQESRLQTPEAADSLSRNNLRNGLHTLQGKLCRAYLNNGKPDLFTKMIGEMYQDRPYTLTQVGFLVDIFDKIGAREDALMIARMGEYSQLLRADPKIISRVNTALQDDQTGKSPREVLERYEVLRAEGIRLEPFEYIELAKHQSISESVSLLEEAVRFYQDSYQLLAYLSFTQLQNGDIEDSKETLEAAVVKFEQEAKLLAQFADKGVTPFAGTGVTPPAYELRNRHKQMRTCKDFLTICLNVVDEADEDQLAERLERSIANAGEDPSIVSVIKSKQRIEIERLPKEGLVPKE